VRSALIRLAAEVAFSFSRLGRLLASGLVGALRRRERLQAILAYWDHCASAPVAATLYEWECDFYLRQLPAGGRVLLVGCGSGRDLVGLIRRGFRADGLDIAPRALTLCREALASNGVAARLYDVAVGDARLESDYDAAVFTWQGYGLILERSERIRALQALRAALRPGGCVLLTCVAAADPPRRARFPNLVARLAGSDWSPTSNDIVELSATAGRLALYVEHRFTDEEIAAEARAAGLRVASHEQVDVARAVLVRD
jgi:SAM-dependent methyltransferase